MMRRRCDEGANVYIVTPPRRDTLMVDQAAPLSCRRWKQSNLFYMSLVVSSSPPPPLPLFHAYFVVFSPSLSHHSSLEYAVTHKDIHSAYGTGRGEGALDNTIFVNAAMVVGEDRKLVQRAPIVVDL